MKKFGIFILIILLFISLLINFWYYKTTRQIYNSGADCSIDTELENGYCINVHGTKLLKQLVK